MNDKKKPDVGDDLKVGERLTLPCSGCGGKAIFTAEGENPTFFHTMPYCERFNRVNTVDELVEYMRECGRKRDLS